MKEWWNGPSFFWNGVEDGSGQHFWGGRLEWKAFQKIRMVPQSAPYMLEMMCYNEEYLFQLFVDVLKVLNDPHWHLILFTYLSHNYEQFSFLLLLRFQPVAPPLGPAIL